MTALADGKDEVPDYITKLEKKLNDQYAERKREFEDKRRPLITLRQEQYDAASSDEEKARIDPTRFFTEHHGKVAVLRGIDQQSHTYRIAKELHLNSEFVRDEPAFYYPPSLPEPIMVVGEAKDDVIAESGRVRQEIKGRNAEIRRQVEEAKQMKPTEAKARCDELMQTGDDGDITGQWYLTIPDLDASRQDLDLKLGESNMDIAPRKPGDEFVWGFLHLSGEEGAIRIRLPEQSAWKDNKLTFGWQTDYDEWDDGLVDHSTANRGVIIFKPATTCLGCLEGWVGGPFQFQGFKESVESTAVDSTTGRKSRMSGEAMNTRIRNLISKYVIPEMWKVPPKMNSRKKIFMKTIKVNGLT
jgi:hypothetical protein